MANIQMPTQWRQCGGEERLLPYGYENLNRHQLSATDGLQNSTLKKSSFMGISRHKGEIT